jgi:hypothetical protein
MSDGRAAILMLMIASDALFPPTRGALSIGQSATSCDCFTDHQPTPSITWFLARAPRPANLSHDTPWVARLKVVLQETDRIVVEHSDLRPGFHTLPPLRC